MVRIGRARLVLLIPGAFALLAGLDAALILLGMPAPVTTTRLPQVHGPLLVLGFVGTLVALERSVALARIVGYAAPLLLGLGAIALVTPLPITVGKALLAVGSAAFVVLYIPLWRRSRDVAVLVQVLGAVLATGGALLWLGGVDVPHLLPWLAGFVVLTIAGERLELARVAVLLAQAVRSFQVACAAFLLCVAASLLWPAVGYRLLGLSLLAIVLWLATYDVAKRTVRGTGLVRFSAVCLLIGYFWIGCAGTIWTLNGLVIDGAAYDAVIHAVFLGFTMSMIMAHASVILPAVLRRPLPYRPVFYLPALLLHASLLLRLLGGDAWGNSASWQWGGVFNVVALLLFVVMAAWSSIRGVPKRDRAS
ncbi:hypothetical protein CLV47_108175 [Antricoccus suffuscus]|uniref:NnrS family protein n=1 Tax=Antricoccus suffuscus TaxID=1629062 RepID=A0A2T0ZZN2_9ACTN|nr:hypothetical protein CLV47_108175 [Antricoccus suffuscus]